MAPPRINSFTPLLTDSPNNPPDTPATQSSNEAIGSFLSTPVKHYGYLTGQTGVWFGNQGAGPLGGGNFEYGYKRFGLNAFVLGGFLDKGGPPPGFNTLIYGLSPGFNFWMNPYEEMDSGFTTMARSQVGIPIGVMRVEGKNDFMTGLNLKLRGNFLIIEAGLSATLMYTPFSEQKHLSAVLSIEFGLGTFGLE